MNLKFVNTEAGRYLLGIKDKIPIIKITDNSYHQLLGFENGEPVLKGTFFTYPRIKTIFDPILTKIELANEYKKIQNINEAFLHYSGLETKNYKYPQIYLNVTTFNSTTNGTGQVRAGRATGGTTWAQMVALTTGDNVDDNSDPYMNNGTSLGNWNLARAFATFNTSSLTSKATITAGVNTFSGFFNLITNTDTLSFSLFESTQASGSALALTDFHSFNTTQLITAATLASLTLNTRNTFTLNSSGDAIISKTSYTKFCALESLDYNGSPNPTGDNTTQFRGGASSNNPILTVVYKLPGGGAFLLNFL